MASAAVDNSAGKGEQPLVGLADRVICFRRLVSLRTRSTLLEPVLVKISFETENGYRGD